MKNKKKTTHTKNKKFSKLFSERLSIIEWNSGFLWYFFTFYLLLYYVFQCYFFLYIALKCHINFCCTVNISCCGQWKKASSWTPATSGTDLIFLYLFCILLFFLWPGLIFLFYYYSNHNFILTFILVPFSCGCINPINFCSSVTEMRLRRLNYKQWTGWRGGGQCFTNGHTQNIDHFYDDFFHWLMCMTYFN